MSLIVVACLNASAQKPSLLQQPRTSQPVFEDDRIKVSIPAGWAVRKATVHVTGDEEYDQPVGALLTKGKFKVFLISHNSHASGIMGGRFSEVMQYTDPWVAAEYADACPLQAVRHRVSSKLSRYDLYVDSSNADNKARKHCGNPTASGVLWYGSYFVENCRGEDEPHECESPFMYYEDLAGKPQAESQYQGPWASTYTVTYDTKTPDALPRKGDPELEHILEEGGSIVNSIHYK